MRLRVALVVFCWFSCSCLAPLALYYYLHLLLLPSGLSSPDPRPSVSLWIGICLAGACSFHCLTCVILVFSGLLLFVGLLAPAESVGPVRAPRPEYVAALEAAPEFAWAVSQLSELVFDSEWDPRPVQKSPRLNPDGSHFNRWTQGTLVDVSLSMVGALASSQELPNPFAAVPPVAPSLGRLISHVACLGDSVCERRAEVVARMLHIGEALVPLSSRLVDAFMPRHALTIAGHLNIALLEAASRSIRSPAPLVPEWLKREGPPGRGPLQLLICESTNTHTGRGGQPRHYVYIYPTKNKQVGCTPALDFRVVCSHTLSITYFS